MQYNNAHIKIDNITHICYYVIKYKKKGSENMELKTTQRQREAVRKYEQNNYRLNIVFPKGTKERIEALKLEKTNSAFIRDTVLNKLDELEKILK